MMKSTTQKTPNTQVEIISIELGSSQSSALSSTEVSNDSKSYFAKDNVAFKLLKSFIIGMMLLLTGVGSVSGQIALRGTATTASSTTTTLTINKPTGVVSGDIMIVAISKLNSTNTITAPTGWTSIDGRSLAGSTARYGAVFYKIAGASEGANYAFSLGTGTTNSSGAIVAFSGVNNTTPFDVTPGTISVQGSQTEVDATSITTVTTSAAVIMLGMAANSSPTWSGWTTTSPGALTQIASIQSTNTTTTGIAWAIKPTAGSTGTGKATLSGSERNGGLLIALKPAINTITLTSAAGTNAQTVCINTPITNITYSTTGATGATFANLPSGVNGSWTGDVVTISGIPTVTGTFNYTVTLTGGSGTGTATGTITVNPNLPVSLSISSSANSICAGTSVIFTATPTNGGTLPAYQWKVNGSNAGTNSATYAYIPLNNDLVTCVLTSNASPCASGSPASSNTVTMIVNPILPVSISIVPSANSVCAGTSVTFTASPTNGGATPTYQWKVNGTNAGTNSATYAYIPLNNDLVTCVLTSNASPCATGSPATSNTVTMIVNPINTLSLSSIPGTDAQTLCISTPITNITYHTAGATGATVTSLPTGVTGSWANNVVTISGTPTASGPFSYTVTSTGGCSTVTATGTINVTAANTISLTSAIGTNAQTLCINTALTNITYSTTGATGAIVTGLPAGVTGSWAGNVVTISGTPTASGTATYTVTLTGGCPTTATGTIIVTPNNTLSLTSAAGTDAQTGCINTPITNITYGTTVATGATITGLPAGLTGNSAGNVVTITGTPTVSGTFTYTVTLTGGCSIVTTTGTMTVTPANTQVLSSDPGTIGQILCINTPITNITYATTGATGATFSGLPAGVTGNWAGNVATISGTPTASGTFTYTVTLTGGCGMVTATGTITVQINTILLTSAVGTNAQALCINTPITNITYATTGATDATVTGLPAGVTGSWAGNVVTISGTPTVSGTFNYTITLTGGCSIVTAIGTLTVNPNNTLLLTSSVGTDAQTLCINTPITTITYSTAGAMGATVTGLPTGVTGSWVSNVVTITGTPTVSGTATYTVTLTGGCSTVTTTGSITVTPANTISLTSAAGTNAQTLCVNTAITNITYATTGATGATFSGLPSGITGSWDSNVVTISGTPTASGTVTYTVTLNGGCSTITAIGTINVQNNTISLTSASGTDAQTGCINTPITNITYGTTIATGATVTGLPAGLTGNWAGNVVTITGTPTVSGTFTYTVTLTGGCSIVTTTGTMTVTPANTQVLSSDPGTIGQILCINTPITNITYATTGATGATFSGLPAGVTGNWAGNVATISGTPTASGTFTYTVTLTGGCGMVTATGTITVQINTILLTSAVGTNAQALCINTPITNITYATTGATDATVTGLPAGVTGSWAGNVVTISGTPTVSGTFNYTITLTGGCSIVTAIGTLTVNPNNTLLLTSSVGTDAQTLCINTPITTITYSTAGAMGATVTGLPTGVTGSWVSNVVTITGTPTVSGTATYTVTLTGGCSTVTTTGTITVTPANTISLTSAAGTNAQTLCVNTAITNITYATTGATGATFAGLPSGVAGNWAGNVVTISGSPTTSSTFNFTITLTGGCGIVTSTGTLTVNPTTNISGQSTGGQTQFQGSAFTPITVTASGVGLSYQWYSNTTASTSGGTPLSANGGRTSSYTPQSTSIGTLYYYCIVNGTCTNVTSVISGAFIVNAIPPAFSTSTGSLTGLTYAHGTITATNPSQSSFTVNGTNLTGNIIITAPTDFEISTISGTGFTSSQTITLTPSSGTLSATSVYVRLKVTSPVGAYTAENIVCSTSGAASINVAASGTVTGTTYYSIASGNWIANTTWSLTPAGGAVGSGIYPLAGDLVNIQANNNVTATTDASCSSITFTGNGGTLTVNAIFTVSVSGAITLNSANSAYATTITGNGNLNAASIAIGTNITPTSNSTTSLTTSIANIFIFGNLSLYNSSSTFPTRTNNATYNLSSGTVTVNGSVTSTNEGGSNTSTLTMATGSQNGILILGGATPFSLTGSNTITLSGTTTFVNYNYAGAQTVYPVTYTNLTLSNSGAKTTSGVNVNGVLSMEGTATASVAPTYGSGATLQYNTSTSRTAGPEWVSPFNAAGGIIIANTGLITMNSDEVFGLSAPFTINAGANFGTANYSLTFGGNFVNNGTFTAGSSPIIIANTATTQTISGFTTTGTVSMTKTGGTATLQGNVNGGALTINGNGGTLNLGTGWTHTFTGNWTRTNGTLNGGSSLLRIGSSVSGTGGTFTAGTGIVEWYAGAQSLAGVTYNNLTLSGTSLKTIPAYTVNGILSMEGTATVSAAPTYGTNATLQYNTATARTAGVEWPSPVAGTGGIIIKNTGTITMNSAESFNASVPLNITGGASFSTGNYQLTLGGDFINAGTFTAGSSPIVITGTAPTQNISGFTTSGTVSMTKTSGIATLTGAVTTTSSLTLSGLINLGTGLSHEANSLYFGAAGQDSGIWGSTGSTAIFTNSTYFGTTSTGLLHVDTYKCALGTWTGNVSTDWFDPHNWCSGTIPGPATNVTIPSGGNQPTIGTSFIATCNDITIAAGATLTISASGTLTVSGNWANSGSLVTNNLSTVTYNGTNQSVGAGTYYNLVLSNSGTKTLNGVTTTNGDLTVNNGVTLNMSTFLLTLNGNLVNTGTVTGTTGGVTITGTATTQNIGAFTTTGTVTMSKTAGTATFTGNVNGAGLTMSGLGGTLDLGAGFTHTFNGTWTRTNGTLLGNTSILRIGGSVSGVTGTFTPQSGTVEWYASAAQTLAGVSYNNLTLSGSSAKTLSALTTSITGNLTLVGSASTTGVVGLTIGGDVIIGSGTSFSGGAFTHNVAGNWTNNGTFTPSTSTIILNGNNPTNITGSSTTGFSTLQINKAAAATMVTSSSKAFTVASSLTVTQGNLILQATDANYAISMDLNVLPNGTLTHSVNWDANPAYLLSVGGSIAIDGKFVYTVRSNVQMTGAATTIRTGSSSLSILTLANTSGSITANGTVNVDDNFWASFNTGGNFTTGPNTITAKSGIMNAGGAININLGGILNVTGGLLVGTSNLNGAVNLSLGTLNADFMTIGNGTRTGIITQSGGIANIGNLFINPSCSYTCTNSPVINISGNWTNNGTFAPATGTVTMTGGGQSISGSATQSFNNLTIGGTGTTMGTAVTTTTTGSLTINSGSTFTLGALLTLNGNMVNNGTINGTGAVNIAGGVAQSIGGFTTSGLVSSIKSGGTANLMGTVTAGSFTVNNTTGGMLNLGIGFTHTATTLTLGSTGQPSGLYGGTTSGATYMIPTYFSAATGLLNILNSSCTSGSWIGNVSVDWNTGANWCDGTVPTSITDVTINPTTNQPQIGAAAQCHNITLNGTATLTITGTNTLTVGGDWTSNSTFAIGGGTVTMIGTSNNILGGGMTTFNNLTLGTGAVYNLSSAIALTGDLVNQGSLSGTGAITLTGTATQNIGAFTTSGTVSMQKTGGTALLTGNINGGALTINGTGGTLNMGTGLTHIFTGTWTRTAGTLDGGTNTTMKLGSGFTGIGGTFIADAGTVEWNGGIQTIAGLNYNNLTLSGTGTKTISAATTAGGDVTVNSGITLQLANYLLTLNGNLFNNGTVTGGTGGVTISGAGTQSIGAFTTTGTVTLSGTGIQSIGAFTSGPVTMTKTGGTATFTVGESGTTLTINGAGGTLNLGTGLSHTFTGVVTLTAGTLNGGSSTLNENATSTSAWNGTGSLFIAGTGTVNFGGAAQTIATSTTFNNLTLSGSGTKILGAGATTIVAGNLNIGNGITFATGAIPLTVTGTTTLGGGTSGTLTISSNAGAKLFTGLVTINAGAAWNNTGNCPVEFRGGINSTPVFTAVNAGNGVQSFTTNTQTLTGTFTIPNMTVTGVTLTNNTSLNVTTALSGTGGLTQAASALLTIGGTSSITTLNATNLYNTVIYNGAAQTVHSNDYYHLTLSGSGAVTLPAVATNILGILTFSGAAASTYTALAGLAVGGDVVLTSGTFIGGTFTHTLAGNWTNNGGTFTAGSGTIIMTGATKILGGTASTTFNNLTLGNGAGQSYSLGYGETVNGILNLQNNTKLTLGASNLTLGLAATCTGTFSNTCMIVTNDGGKLQQNVSAIGSVTFPVGDVTNGADYSPITINFTSGVYAAGATVSVKVTNAKQPNNISINNYLNRYWSVSQTGITTFTANVSGNYVPADIIGTESNEVAGVYLGSNIWLRYASLAANTLTANGVAAFGDFTGLNTITTLTTSTNALTGFSYPVGFGPSTQNIFFTVSGDALTSNIKVLPTESFDISLTSGALFAPQTLITLPVNYGMVVLDTIYVRMKAGFSLGAVTPATAITCSTDNVASETVSCSGVVTNLPLITVSPATLNGFTYTVGGTSAAISFSVSGTNLNSPVIITAPTDYKICLTTGGVYVSSLSLTPTGGSISATNIFVKMNPGLSMGIFNETISLTSTNAVSQIVTCNGSVTLPTINLSTSMLGGFIYNSGSAPSNYQTFTVNGTNLTSSIVLTAPANYGICLTSGGTYTTTISLTQTGGTVPLTTIYLHLNGSLVVNTYNGILTATSTSSPSSAIPQNVTCSGQVFASGTPGIFSSVTSLNGFVYLLGSTTSVGQSFTVSGTSLTNGLTITPTSTPGLNYEICLTSNGTFVSTPLTISGTSVNAQPVYVRLKTGLGLGTVPGNIALASGSTTVNVSIGNSKVIAVPTIAAGPANASLECNGANVILTSSGSGYNNQYWTGPNGLYSGYSVAANDTLGIIANVNDPKNGTYTVTGTALSGTNLLANPGFENGNIGFSSSYQYIAPSQNALSTGGTNGATGGEGLYTVTNSSYPLPSSVHPSFSPCADHTPTPGAYQMVINGANSNGIIAWSESVNVVPSTNYQFNYWVQTVSVAGNPAQLQLYMNGVQVGPVYVSKNATCDWIQFIYNVNSGSSTVLQLALINWNAVTGGNDFALDDMDFEQAFPVTSSVNVIANPSMTPYVTIMATSNPLYSGSSVTFIATPTNGGATPTYQWWVDGKKVGNNSFIYSYIPAGNDSIRCVMTSNYPCINGNPIVSSNTLNAIYRANFWIGTNGTDWNNTANWTANYVPSAGADVEFATVANNGQAALNDLVLDKNRTIGSLINSSGKQLFIPAGKGLIVNNTITTDNDVNRIYIQSTNGTDGLPNGSLTFHNTSGFPVNASVEMYSIASWDKSQAVGSQYKWQYFGIPLRSVVANPTFYGSYVRKWVETGDSTTNHWIQLGNESVLTSFLGYEICQQWPEKILFQGQLENGDFSSGQMGVTSTALYPGQHIYANPYTAAIDITQLNFGTDTEATVYLYNTGSYNDWTVLGNTGPGNSPGQYTAVPKIPSGNNGLPSQVPSMGAMLVKAMNGTSQATFGISYNSVIENNSVQQRVKASNDITSSDKVCTVIDVTGTSYSDRMWLFTQPGCTHHFDNGWDGAKMLGSAMTPQLFAMETDGNYQVDAVDDVNGTNLGFQAGVDVNYTLTFTHTNIKNRYAGIYLMDKMENKTIDITESGSTYSFQAESTSKPVNRFTIITRPYEQTSTDNNSQLKIFSTKGTVLVQDLSSLNGEVMIYDLAGHYLKTATLEPYGGITTVTGFIPGVYIAKAATSKEEVTKRLIVQ